METQRPADRGKKNMISGLPRIRSASRRPRRWRVSAERIRASKLNTAKIGSAVSNIPPMTMNTAPVWSIANIVVVMRITVDTKRKRRKIINDRSQRPYAMVLLIRS